MRHPTSRVSLNTQRSRVVPIVFVPGIMGTRLSFHGGEVEWDPDSPITRMAKWTLMSAEYKADVLNFETPAKIIDEDVDQGWSTVAKAVYRDFLTTLDKREFLKNVDTPVYAVGFDWRQSNEVSGSYLATKISRVLEIEQAPKAIVITHSMGGLVARSAMRQTKGLMDKVLGVVHVAQPVAGAVVLYRRVFTGALQKWDGTEEFTKILDEINNAHMRSSAKILGLRFKIKEQLTPEEWRTLTEGMKKQGDRYLGESISH